MILKDGKPNTNGKTMVLSYNLHKKIRTTAN